MVYLSILRWLNFSEKMATVKTNRIAPLMIHRMKAIVSKKCNVDDDFESGGEHVDSDFNADSDADSGDNGSGGELGGGAVLQTGHVRTS